MILPQYGFQWFRGSKWFELFNVKLIFIRMADWTNKKQLSFLNWKLLYLEKWCFFHLHFFLRLVGVVCFLGEKGLEFFYGITLWNLILIQASYLSLSHTHSHTRTHTPTPTHMHAHLTLNRKKTISDVNSSRVNILSLNLRKHFCHDGLKTDLGRSRQVGNVGQHPNEVKHVSYSVVGTVRSVHVELETSVGHLERCYRLLGNIEQVLEPGTSTFYSENSLVFFHR